MMISKKNTIVNIIISFLSQALILILGIIVPKIIINNYGSDTNGFTSTVNQIFSYMALLEAGVSIATRNQLYKPVAEHNQHGVSYWMSISRRYFRKISYIYLACVIGLSLILPLALKSDIEYFSIFLYTLFEGLVNVVSFYFLNTWKCLLTVEGKNYIINSINLLVRVLCYVIKIILAVFKFNIALIQVGFFIVSLIELVIMSFYMKRKYGWINYKEAPLNIKLPDKNNFIVNEIAWTVFSSTDMIILSIFVSTSLSSVYSVYNMIFSALNGLLGAVYNALNFNLGLAFKTDLNRYKKLHDIFNSVFIGLVTVLVSVSYFISLPFIELYTKGVSDIEYIHPYLPLLFSLVQILTWSRHVSGNLTSIAGYSKQVSRISIAEAAINLLSSLVLVYFLGIEGVVLATAIALPIKVFYTHYISEKKILNRKCCKTILILLGNYSIFGITVFLRHFIIPDIHNYVDFFIWGGILVIIYLVVSFVVNVFINNDLLKIKHYFSKKQE